ncbi:CBS domain-containing protein [Thalassobacillus devorans]|uniref:CBS domain-containing protein n=1 Tax=Thalassobacillus devorans TaxID=279813 RepID=UPI00048DCAD9|nr:CBS domain-containing protein [Thalassobacillus devorans]
MLVKNNIIPKHRVVSIYEDATMSEAKRVLDKSEYRCIPAVNSNGEYRGMIFRSRIERYENECFRNGDTPDENEHITNVLAYPETYVYEETSFPQAMLRVKALPFIAVLDKREKFVGILTHNKVFDLLEQSFGLHAGDYIFTIASPEKHGAVAQLSKMLNKRGINIEGLMTFDDDGSRVVRRLCIAVSNVTKAQLSELFAKLEKKGYRVLRSEQTEKNDQITRTILED